MKHTCHIVKGQMDTLEHPQIQYSRSNNSIKQSLHMHSCSPENARYGEWQKTISRIDKLYNRASHSVTSELWAICVAAASSLESARGVLLSVQRNISLSTIFVSFGYKHSIVNVKARMLLFSNLKKTSELHPTSSRPLVVKPHSLHARETNEASKGSCLRTRYHHQGQDPMPASN